MTLEVTSFDLRHAGNQFEQDRYLFYVVPLLAVGTVAALTDRTGVRLRAGALAVAAAMFVAADTLVSYRDGTPIWWAAPAAAFHPRLASAAGAVGLSAGTFVRLAVVALAVVLVVVLVRGPMPAGLWACGLAVAAFGAFEAAWEFHRYVVPSLTVRSTVRHRTWIDDAALVVGRARAEPVGRAACLVGGRALEQGRRPRRAHRAALDVYAVPGGDRQRRLRRGPASRRAGSSAARAGARRDEVLVRRRRAGCVDGRVEARPHAPPGPARVGDAWRGQRRPGPWPAAAPRSGSSPAPGRSAASSG